MKWLNKKNKEELVARQNWEISMELIKTKTESEMWKERGNRWQISFEELRQENQRLREFILKLSETNLKRMP